jgi:hypothetical protein
MKINSLSRAGSESLSMLSSSPPLQRSHSSILQQSEQRDREKTEGFLPVLFMTLKHNP